MQSIETKSNDAHVRIGLLIYIGLVMKTLDYWMLEYVGILDLWDS